MLLKKIISKKKPKQLKLYWWRYENSIHGNFGDEITRLIVEKNFSKKVEWAPPPEADLIATGSILDIVIQERGDNNPIIWGSGFIEQKESTISYADCTVAAVRGKSTLSRITDVPNGVKIVLGDPGLLADSLIPTGGNKRYRLGVIPHYVDIDNENILQFKDREGVLTIDPTGDCLTVIEEINSCDAIISSSLHGLIVSDSLGIPNLHMQLGNGLKGGLYKFHDYYSVFNEDRYHQITPEILNKTTETLLEYINLHFVKPSNMKSIKKSIKKSFPY